MGASADIGLETKALDDNLAALAAALPRAADLVRDADVPCTLRPRPGRDGAATFAWTDDCGRLRWLGRTTMPLVRAEALVEAFRPGSGNVLFCGLGQGAEAALLLARLAPHQAVVIIEETPWTVRAALSLHDFSADLARRRLVIFTGPRAWDDCCSFLLDHPGFLAPERMLGWPWFDPKTIAELSARLGALQADSAKARGRLAQIPPPKANVEAPRNVRRLAVVSNVVDRRVRIAAREIESAAGVLGWSCRRFVLDDPAMVHPQVVAAALRNTRPERVICIDIASQTPPYALPPAPVFVFCSHEEGLSADWLRSLPPDVRLGVRTQRQHDQALSVGLDAARVIVLPPAASVSAAALGERPVSDRRLGPAKLLVVADAIDDSAEAAGLHLVTHCRLWEAARAVILERIDDYCDGDAEKILAAAERKIDTGINSSEVRRGLTERIRDRLGPGLVRRAYLTALADAGVAFDLYGAGWGRDERLRPFHRGPWPEMDVASRRTSGPSAVSAADTSAAADLTASTGATGCSQPVPSREATSARTAALGAFDAVICLETSGRIDPFLLDAIAAGLVAFVRRHPIDATPDGLSAVLDPEAHVNRFAGKLELVKVLSRFATDPQPFFDRAGVSAMHVRTHHTWRQRLEMILSDE